MNVDELDYEQIVATHHEHLYRFAFSLAGNPDDASELAQGTYVLLFTEGSEQVAALNNGITTLSWSDDRRVYVLAGHGSEQELRNLL